MGGGCLDFSQTRGRGRSRLSDRLILDGLLWMLCSGVEWRDVPHCLAHGHYDQRCCGWRKLEEFDHMLNTCI
ncbi:transposase [Pseudomonas urmiensis]|uniref:transposase n=1 Tax=Pseudomonas urmiensis TaxID=2745493 RepID=UPI0034620DE0